jgi:hypothetical protein
MHHIALCTPCIELLLVSHTCAFCDRPHTELELEEPMEQAQVEDFINLYLNQGNPRCINQ